jgi:hypothetical protein
MKDTDKNRERLNSIIRAAQRRGAEIEPRTQRELILYRIAGGNGKPVPLPEIQQGPGSRFVSDPQARVHELRALGYLIDCEAGRVGDQRHSSYLLLLNADGTPQIKHESFIERYQRQHPKKPAPQAQPEHGGIRNHLLWETGGIR